MIVNILSKVMKIRILRHWQSNLFYIFTIKMKYLRIRFRPYVDR